jgi:hypothetical protein
MSPGGVDLYVGGVEHAVLHLLYARFWHKVLYDLGYVSTPEPFARLVNQGYILADAFTDERGMYVPAAEVVTAADGSARYRGQPVTRRAGKMGKSLKNGVSPDEIYRQYGADTLRLQEMAMGPLETDRAWLPRDIAGVHRFLQRLWRAVISEQTGQAAVSDEPPAEDIARLLHRTIALVRRDFAELRFNTAIARLIELTTAAARTAAENGAKRASNLNRYLKSIPYDTHQLAGHVHAMLGSGRRRLSRHDVDDPVWHDDHPLDRLVAREPGQLGVGEQQPLELLAPGPRPDRDDKLRLAVDLHGQPDRRLGRQRRVGLGERLVGE